MSLEKSGKVLVTGGAGFIGSHVVDKLLVARYAVRVLDDLSTGKLVNILEHVREVEFVKGDIRDSKIVERGLQDVDVVLHLAAITSIPFSIGHPELTHEINVEGTQKILNACVKAGVKKGVFISSCAVYGDPQHLPIDEEHPTHPLSPYAVSKLEGEQLFKNCRKECGMKTVILRLFNVYGPRQGLSEYCGVIVRFMDRARRDMSLTIYGDGNQTRDFVHVWDVADVILNAMRCKDAEGEVFNIGSGKATTVNDLALSVLDLFGSDADIFHEKPRKGEIRDSYGDISKAKRVLGFEPKVSLETGLRSLVEEE